MNAINKKIWDDIFAQQPPQPSDDDCCEVMCDSGDGCYKPATPIGFDDEQKTFDALKDIIEGAIKNKTYKTWKMKSELFETYSEKHAPIEEFDVIYIFSSDWEEARFPVLVKEIRDTEIELWWLGGRDGEETCKQSVSYKK